MKACVIGLGRMGRRHLEAARRVGLTVAGAYDPLPASVDATVAEGAIAREAIYPSFEVMLATCRPAALVVSSTAPSHADYVCQAAAAGVRYILCEKPMAVSLAECDQMVETCERYGARLGVNHQMQYMEQYTVVKKMAELPEFGGLRSITVAAANFGLAMNGVHYFEMFRYMTGEELESVSFHADAEIVPNPRGKEYEDRSGQLFARSASGRRLILEIGGDLGHGIQVVYGCRYGQIIVDELAGKLRAISRQEEFRNLPTTRYGMPATEELRQIAPADVIEPTADVWRGILAGGDFPDGLRGRHAVRALVAAQVSAGQGGLQVSLAGGLPVDTRYPWA